MLNRYVAVMFHCVRMLTGCLLAVWLAWPLSFAQDIAVQDMPNVDLDTEEGQQFARHREAMCKVILHLMLAVGMHALEKGEGKTMDDIEMLQAFLKSFPSNELLSACPEEFVKLFCRQKSIVEYLVKGGKSWRENEGFQSMATAMQRLAAAYELEHAPDYFGDRILRELNNLENHSDRLQYIHKLREGLKTGRLVIPDSLNGFEDAEEGLWLIEAGAQ